LLSWPYTSVGGKPMACHGGPDPMPAGSCAAANSGLWWQKLDPPQDIRPSRGVLDLGPLSANCLRSFPVTACPRPLSRGHKQRNTQSGCSQCASRAPLYWTLHTLRMLTLLQKTVSSTMSTASGLCSSSRIPADPGLGGVSASQHARPKDAGPH